ncbi:hypothetical protein BJV82DRAFT_646737 [Fennellomyces sp. T-0311]|nr:hypothetical protein BJV82DRAFT_646737 [Fennellomyces sp. T-0311]
MSSFSSKLSRVRSVKLSAFGHRQQRSPSPNPPPSSSTPSQQPTVVPRTTTSTTERRSIPRSRTVSGRGLAHHSFGETLRAMSKEARSGEFADVFGSFFFSDKRCQNRAFFMAARLKQTLQPIILSLAPPNAPVDHLWELMTHRLYTLNYILFVLPATCDIRSRFLSTLEQQLAQIGDGKHVLRRGGMEVHFVVRYVLKKHYWQHDDDEIEDIVERAREVVEHCLESESKLGHAERDAMYVFHGLRMGLHGSFEPHIELDDEYWELARRLAIAVKENKESSQPVYINPFEDDDAIVKDDDDIPAAPSREVDSGFYDHYVTPSGTTASS